MEQGSKNRYAGSAYGSLHSLWFHLVLQRIEGKQLCHPVKLLAQQLLTMTLAAFQDHFRNPSSNLGVSVVSIKPEKMNL